MYLAKAHGFFARHQSFGPLMYISAVQYFIVQYIVGTRFLPAYSLARNTISDLGNTQCGVYNNRMICSPLHPLMNLSFFALGLTMVIGSLYLYALQRKSRGTALGLMLFAVGGAGAMLVGVFPENTISPLHGVGAALPFLIGNIGVAVLGYFLVLPKPLRIYTLASGLVPLAALVIYASGHYIGLGEGGIERVVAYPQTVWMMVWGLYMYRKMRLQAHKPRV